MALVDKTKNHVNMDWESSGFLTKNKGKLFLVACKEYESSNPEYDTLTVMFTPKTAFLFIYDKDGDDETLYNIGSIKKWLKDNYDSSFPTMYEEYTPLIDGDQVDSYALEKYGLTAYADDIIARIEDLEYFGLETDAAE